LYGSLCCFIYYIPTKPLTNSVLGAIILGVSKHHGGDVPSKSAIFVMPMEQWKESPTANVLERPKPQQFHE